MFDRKKVLFNVAIVAVVLTVSAGAVTASSHTGGDDGTEISTNVTVSPEGEGETSTYTVEFTYDSVGDETAQFVSVDFGSDADFGAVLNDSNNVAVSSPDGSNLDVAGTLNASGALVVQLGDGEGIGDSDEGNTYTVEVQEVVNPSAGDYNLTLGLHDESDEILDTAGAAFAADTAAYSVGGDAATVTFENQTAQNSTVVVESTTLPQGGFVTVHDSSLNDGDALGSVVGVSDYLGNGSHEGVEIETDLHDEQGGEHEHTYVAMPHRDTNGNEEYDFVDSEGGNDGPYTADGGAVVDSAQVTVGSGMGDDGMEGDGMEGNDTDMGDGEDNGTDGNGDDGSEEDGGQGMPGFTAVASLVALVGAALLARRAE